MLIEHEVKRDPSKDLNVTSLAQDTKAWKSKGFYSTNTPRFPRRVPGKTNGSFLNNLPGRGEDVQYKFYDAKPDLSNRVDRTKEVYAVVHNKSRKDVDSRAKLAGKQDVRYDSVKDSYPVPIGPGTYVSTEEERKVAGIRVETSPLPSSPSRCFLSPGREEKPAEDLPPMSDTLSRDSKSWISKGYYSARTDRYKGPTWPKAKWEGTFREKAGLRGMNARQDTPALHKVYSDASVSSFFSAPNMNLTGGYRSRRPGSPEFVSKSPRLALLPNFRHNDFRLRGAEGARGSLGATETIGPGGYFLDMEAWANLALDPQTSSASRTTATALGASALYRSTGPGSPRRAVSTAPANALLSPRYMTSTGPHSHTFSALGRFYPYRNGNTSPRKDSALSRTW